MGHDVDARERPKGRSLASTWSDEISKYFELHLQRSLRARRRLPSFEPVVQRMIVFGIDPGSSKGAVAWVSGNGSASVFDLPLVDRALDPHSLSEILGSAPSSPAAVFVERVGAFPGQGIASAFRFGQATGAIHACVQLCGLRLDLATPSKWKRHYGLGPDKEKARALAIRRYPGLALELARKKDADRAEALLIAEYGLVSIACAASA